MTVYLMSVYGQKDEREWFPEGMVQDWEEG